MLALPEFERLLADIESDRVERTVSLNNTDKFSEAVCAFANDFPNHRQPGYLLLGVEDSGTLSGLTIDDSVLQRLGAIRSDGNVLPQPALTVQKFSMAGGDVAVLKVLPSDLPPVRYKGRVFIRVGPRRAIANEQEERLLSERRTGLSKNFDAQACRESTLADLALPLFDTYRRQAVDEETIAANHRPIEQQLASLRLFDQERKSATHAGILLLGTNPRFFLPGAYVQYLRLPGTSLTDAPLDQAEISGDLLTLLRELEARVRLLNQTSLRQVSEFREKLASDYPDWALREILMNAVMHRNYDSNSPIRFYVFSDHIEIQSPGGLYGEATRENFPTRNSYRNPIVAEAMKSLGFVNRFGYGVQRAQALLHQNGNPPPEFQFEVNSVLVKVYRRPD